MVGTAASSRATPRSRSATGLRRRDSRRPRFACSLATDPRGGGRRHAWGAGAPGGPPPCVGGRGTRRASANEPRAHGSATPVAHSQPAREDRHGVPTHPGGCRTPGRPRRQPQRGAEPRASHLERPQGQGGGWGRRRGAEGRGPGPSSAGHAGPVPSLLLRTEPERPPPATAKGACRETQTRGAKRTTTAVCLHVRGGDSGGWRLKRTPGFLRLRAPRCKGARPRNTDHLSPLRNAAPQGPGGRMKTSLRSELAGRPVPAAGRAPGLR